MRLLLPTTQLLTPFLDALIVETRKIREGSSRVRSAAFIKGVTIGALTLMIWKPFQWNSEIRFEKNVTFFSLMDSYGTHCHMYWARSRFSLAYPCSVILLRVAPSQTCGTC